MDYTSYPVQQHAQQRRHPKHISPPSPATAPPTMPAADRPKRTAKHASSKFQPTKNTGSWAPSKILTPSSAILSPTVDIHAFLITCISGFDSYSEDEKRGIIDSLPVSYRQYNTDSQGKLLCPISTDFVMGDVFLKRAIAKFANDVRDGYYDPAWQAKARKAMQEREEGKFDEYVQQHVEDMFGDASADASQEGSGDGGRAREEAMEEQDARTDLSPDGEWVESKARKTEPQPANVSKQSGRSRRKEMPEA